MNTWKIETYLDFETADQVVWNHLQFKTDLDSERRAPNLGNIYYFIKLSDERTVTLCLTKLGEYCTLSHELFTWEDIPDFLLDIEDDLWMMFYAVLGKEQEMTQFKQKLIDNLSNNDLIFEDDNRKSKRGPRHYSVKEKIDAVLVWERWDRDRFPTTIEEFLENKFGVNTDSTLCVAKSTFYDWRDKYKKGILKLE
jgi:hypothetical protein